jgi:ABC-2 type transport system permease protein
MLRVTPFVHVVSLVSITALVFPLTALALGYGTFYPRFDSENAAQIPTSFGGLLFMITAIGLIGVVAFLAGRPAARWVVAEHFGRVRDPLDLAVPFSMGVLVCAAATALPLLLARQRLNALERG